MQKNIQGFVIDIFQNMLNINIEVIKEPSNYHIFHNALFQSLEIDNYIKTMELNHEFQYGFYYCIHTSLKIYFTLIPIEEKENQIEEYLMIGPYLIEDFTNQVFDQICKENRIAISNIMVFRAFYTTLPSIAEKQAETIAASVMKHILEIEEPAKILKEINISIPFVDKMLPTESFHITSEILEQRYQQENMLLSSILDGDAETSIKIMSSWNAVTILPKPKDKIRSWKNLSITTNTLYRKTLEYKHVHPYYLDQVSRKYAILIENATTQQQLDTIHINMIYEYCKLAKQVSLSEYSLTIRKAIDYINLNLSKDLSLDLIAKEMELAPSYLSALFKKEVKITITEFIHKKRCDHAAALLTRSNMNVSEIAEQIGIPDSSYFTYLFKRYYNMTPTQYRNKHKAKRKETKHGTEKPNSSI